MSQQHSQGPERVPISGAWHLHEEIRALRRFGFLFVHYDHEPVSAPVGEPAPDRIGRIALHVTRVRHDWVATPKYDEVRAVLALAEGAGGFADLLERDNGRRVTGTGGGVDGRADPVRERDCRALALRRAARQPVDEWVTRGSQDLRGAVERGSRFGRLTVE